jgi:acetyl esterase/lipase
MRNHPIEFFIAAGNAPRDSGINVSHGSGAAGLRRIIVVALALLMAACSGKPKAPAPIADPDARRTVAQGALVGGKDLYDSHSWLAIPYAAPPVGERRWKAPAPPSAWSGERKATQFGSECTQLASPLGGSADLPVGSVRGSEDCLSLNVYAPRFPTADIPARSEKLPVIVWIHGGANRSGSADFYHGGNLAATHNLIVVTVNYRLGPLGWFYHPALAKTAASPEEASGNFALLDLIAALGWLRENVAAFGGDPGNITIMGESAGANNVLSLLVTPAAKGLYHRAILQSALPRFATPAFASRAFAARPNSGDTKDNKDTEEREETNQTNEYDRTNGEDGGDESHAAAFDPREIPHPNSSGEVIARLLLAEGKADRLAAARIQAGEESSADLARFLRSLSAKRIIDAYRGNLKNENNDTAYYEFPH